MVDTNGEIVRIDLLLQRWIGILATLLLGWRETWRTRQALVISRDKDSFVVRQGESFDGAVVATLLSGAPASPEFVRTSQRRFITFELPADEVAVRRIAVPTRAREFLAGIVRNQIERLSPWQGDQVAYGFAAEVNPKDAGTLDVRVLMTSNEVGDARPPQRRPCRDRSYHRSDGRPRAGARSGDPGGCLVAPRQRLSANWGARTTRHRGWHDRRVRAERG